METRKVWVIEEVKVDGAIAHRKTESSYTEESDGTWFWNIPEDRFTSECQDEWKRIMDTLKDVNGEDMRHLVSAVSFMTHCLEPDRITNYSV